MLADHCGVEHRQDAEQCQNLFVGFVVSQLGIMERAAGVTNWEDYTVVILPENCANCARVRVDGDNERFLAIRMAQERGSSDLLLDDTKCELRTIQVPSEVYLIIAQLIQDGSKG